MGALMTDDTEIRGHVAVTIGMCFLAAILEGYDIQAFGIAAPKLVAALSLNPSQQGLTASAAMVGLVFGAFGGGKLADAFGRKPVLLLSVAMFGIGSLWTATGDSFFALLPARFVTGLGFGGAYPVLIAIAAEVSPPSRRNAATCLLFCGMPAGGSLVSLFANFAGEQLDWRMIFIVGGAIPLVILPLLWFFLRETTPAHDDSADVKLLPALFGGGRGMATILLAAASFLALVVLYLILNWLPSLVVAKGHLSGDGAAASFAFNIAGVVGALLLGILADFTGVRRALVLAYGTILVALYFLGAAQSVIMIVAWSGLLGIFTPSISFVLYGLAPVLYPLKVRAAASGAIVGIGRLGTIAGPLLAGQLRQIGWSAEFVIDAMLPIVLVGGLCAFVLTVRFRSAVPLAQPA
jgi:AAHS family 3-hydroxyphenylpropionic acid transporter